MEKKNLDNLNFKEIHELERIVNIDSVIKKRMEDNNLNPFLEDYKDFYNPSIANLKCLGNIY